MLKTIPKKNKSAFTSILFVCVLVFGIFFNLNYAEAEVNQDHIQGFDNTSEEDRQRYLETLNQRVDERSQNNNNNTPSDAEIRFYGERGLDYDSAVRQASIDRDNASYINTGTGIVAIILNLISDLVMVIIGLALLYFIWGLFKYVVAGSPEDKKSAISIIVNGTIALFVMVTFWGLVFIIVNTFNLQTYTPETSGILSRVLTSGSRPVEQGLIQTLVWLMDSLVRIIISLTFLYFLIGLIKYGFAKSSEEQKTARATIFNGLIILFVMISVWGLVGVISNTFDIDVVGDTPSRGGSTNTIDSL